MTWISVDYRPPPFSGKVLVVTEDSPIVRPALYINDGKEIPWRWWAHVERPMKGVTHWMPFPKMPKEKT
jgi:hypothetical protein